MFSPTEDNKDEEEGEEKEEKGEKEKYKAEEDEEEDDFKESTVEQVGFIDHKEKKIIILNFVNQAEVVQLGRDSSTKQT